MSGVLPQREITATTLPVAQTVSSSSLRVGVAAAAVLTVAQGTVLAPPAPPTIAIHTFDAQSQITVFRLTQPAERGLMVQQSVVHALRRFQHEGLISSFEEVGMEAESVTFQAYMPIDRWNMENRELVHETALSLQAEFHVAVIIDLQRERARGRSA